MAQLDVNPFRFGALALDDAFTDRDAELAELVGDVRAGQDVVVYAPRRYGKSSLVWRAAQQLTRHRVLVAQVDLMTTPTPGKLAEKLARAIHDDIASPLIRAKDRLKVFSGLRIRPTVTIDPDGSDLSFSFDLAAAAPADVSATLERLLELPAVLAADRGRQVALVFDEFQEVADIDPGLPKLMRAVFQAQPDVAHVYLGSRRHMLQRIFSDANEPFWRSAKQLDLGVIPPVHFEPYLTARFADSGRVLAPATAAGLLEITGGHPYATQELAYFLWHQTPKGRTATPALLEAAVDRVLASEHTHFSLVWERASAAQRRVLQALAVEPGRVLSAEYRRRHGLPAPSSVQRAIEALEREELVVRERGGPVRISEPFLAQWLRRER